MLLPTPSAASVRLMNDINPLSALNNSMPFTRVSRLVISCDSVDEVLQSILEEALLMCDAERGFIAIADQDRGELDVRYTAGSAWSEEKRRLRLRVSEDTGRGITSHVAATGRLYNSADVFNDPYYWMFFEDVRSEIAVPMLDSVNRARGVVNIESTVLSAFNSSHEQVLAGLADLAALAMTIADHRAREAALVQIGRELNGFRETNETAILQKVIDVAAEVLKFEDCSLFLLDQVSGKLVLGASRGPLSNQVGKATYELGEGLTGWTAQQQEPIRVANPKGDPRWRGRFEELPVSDVGAYMSVPIHSRNGVIGVLRVQRKKSPYKWFPNDFTEDDQQILETISSQLGIALDNARLVVQIRNTERMAAWGEMSARSAHMIGNRVFAIKGDVNEMEYQLSLGEVDKCESLALADSIKKGIFLLEEILNEFREFVKATQLDVEETDVNELIRQSVDEGFPKRSQTKLSMELNYDIPVIQADHKKLKRCFGEMMENSVNFLPGGGEISVSTSVARSRTKKWLRPEQQSGDYVQIVFQDSGPGVANEDKSRIFDPFFTSRAKGMGLGLSIVKGIVDAHNGAIMETGKPGLGAKFIILLPYDKVQFKKRKKQKRVSS